MLEVETWP